MTKLAKHIAAALAARAPASHVWRPGAARRPPGARAAPPGELPANALVADLGEGLEAVHLYSGRPLCALALAAPGLHADVNGDGVLDHVQVRARRLRPQREGRHGGRRSRPAGCYTRSERDTS
jgi:hypothetical protein